MKVRELVELLKLADPEAEVLSEYDGAYGPVDADDVRVGPAHLTRFDRGQTGAPPYESWSDGDGGGDPRIVRVCPNAVLIAASSDLDWPNRLDGLPEENAEERARWRT